MVRLFRDNKKKEKKALEIKVEQKESDPKRDAQLREAAFLGTLTRVRAASQEAILTSKGIVSSFQTNSLEGIVPFHHS